MNGEGGLAVFFYKRRSRLQARNACAGCEAPEPNGGGLSCMQTQGGGQAQCVEDADCVGAQLNASTLWPRPVCALRDAHGQAELATCNGAG